MGHQNSLCIKTHWTGYSMAPEIIEKLILSASIHPNVNNTGPSKQWLLTTPHDKRRSRSRTIKRPISSNLDEEIPATAVQVHPAPGNLTQQTARRLRPGRESSLKLVSIYSAFPWSPLLALVKRERPTVDMTQHGSSQMFLHHKSLATQPCTPTNLWFFHCYIQLQVPEQVGSVWYIISC